MNSEHNKNDSDDEHDTSEDSDCSDDDGPIHPAASNDGPMDMLQKFFAEKLGLSSTGPPPKPKVLDEVSFEGIIKYIKDGKAQNIITLAGAGISTSAGIPDFRTPGSGLYDNLQKYNLPSPEAIFSIEFFKENPEPFFSLAKELYPGNFTPTPSHYFIKLLHSKGLLLRHYTQNIDTLERVSGLPEEVVVEAHGTFHTSHCLKCKQEYSQEWMKGENNSITYMAGV